MRPLPCLTFTLPCRYTAGIVGGLSTVAVCAPSERFLSIGGPLAIGLGIVFVSSLGKYLYNKFQLLIVTIIFTA
jgi:hypothetical protein